MALDFTPGGSYADHTAVLAAPASLTWLWWGSPNSINNGGRRIIYRGSGLNTYQCYIGDVGFSQNATLRWYHDRATTGTDVIPTGGLFTVGVWYFVAVVDPEGAAPRVYTGTRAVAIAEVASYHTQITGVGASAVATAETLRVGGRNTGTTQAHWKIGTFWKYPSALTLAEIRAHQWSPWRRLPGCTLHVNYGRIGTGGALQADMSGSAAHGTLVNAPTVTANPPIAAPVVWFPAVAPPSGAAGSPVNIAAVVGTLPLAGQTSSVQTGRNVAAGVGALPLAGQAATVATGRDVAAGVGTLPLVGQTATITTSSEVAAGAGLLPLVGQTATISRGVDVVAGAGLLPMVGQAAAPATGAAVLAQQGAQPLFGQAATIGAGALVTALQGLLGLVGQSATVTGATGATATVGLLPLAGQSATITNGQGQVVAGAGALPLVGQSATAYNAGASVTPILRGAQRHTLVRDSAGFTLIRGG